MTMTNRAKVTALKITPLKVNKINHAFSLDYKDQDIAVFEFLIKKHLGQTELDREVLKAFFEADTKTINQIIQNITEDLNLMEFRKLKHIAKESTIEMQHCIKDLYLSALVKESLDFTSKENKNICKKFIYNFLDCSQSYSNDDYSSNCNIFSKDYLPSKPDFISSSISFIFGNSKTSNAEILKNCFSALAFVIFKDDYMTAFEKRLTISDVISLYDKQLDYEKLINTTNASLKKYHDSSDISILSRFETVLDTLKIPDPVSTQLSKMIVDAIEPSNNMKYKFEVFGLNIYQSGHTCINNLYTYAGDLYTYTGNLSASYAGNLYTYAGNLYTYAGDLYTYTGNLCTSYADNLYTYAGDLYSSLNDWMFPGQA